MREMPCSDGCVVLYDENDDQDMAIVEPVVTDFIPTRNSLHCAACGAPLQPWDWRRVAVSNIELHCSHCHRVHGLFRLGTKVFR